MGLTGNRTWPPLLAPMPCLTYFTACCSESCSRAPKCLREWTSVARAFCLAPPRSCHGRHPEAQLRGRCHHCCRCWFRASFLLSYRFLYSTALTPRYVKPRNCQALGAWVTLNVPKRELGADFAGIGTLPRLPRVRTSRWPFFILGLNPVQPLYLWP
jgi:hypothetical protein